MLGLTGADPERIPVESIDNIIKTIQTTHLLNFNYERNIPFNPENDIIFDKTFLPFHANGMMFTAAIDGKDYTSTFYSIGGGFVVKEALTHAKENLKIYKTFPFPISKASELSAYCSSENKSISGIVFENEKSIRTKAEINFELNRIWQTMLECMYIGCHTEGSLPGGLNVRRRAFDIHKKQ